ncbi:HNH endonuclease family protein [Natronoglycomyces albus]|uniref:HNH endonuclease n=1 Tax=Natronoglycomyces albus TaxID=2811108 RepID=A0A895XR27_9ACTN|nr:HNH endonuclease family protein [Natronoglycomyces albus]QSB04038.1 HNH endonuclease [Natronoglycomyces albus]
MKRRLPRFWASIAATFGAVVLATSLATAPAAAEYTPTTANDGYSVASIPPGIPTLSQAQSQLNGLTVEPEGSRDGYSRDLFPHWRVVESPCTARQYVLVRDGSNVQTDSNCQPTSGSWFSEFDGETTTNAGDFDIDHMVPLAEAWRSGAASWTTAERAEFANDVNSSALWAVSRSSNASKGDRDPAEWMPPRTAIHCDYAKSWINVKHLYDLSVDAAERSALQSTLDTAC